MRPPIPADTSMSPPTVVLVHETWHTPAHYKKLTAALQATGLEIHCPLLPTSNGSRPPNFNFSDDVATVRSLILSLVDARKPVMLIMHSYGGVVGSSALDELSSARRSTKGLPGGVVCLVYVCAYILPKGSSVASVVREVGYWDLLEQAMNTDDDGTMALNDPASLLYGDLSPEESAENMKTLVRTPYKLLQAEATFEPWREIPTTYIFTAKDGTVPSVYQKLMTDKVQAEGVVLHREYLDCGHSPFLSRTKSMVAEVWKACDGVGNSRKTV